MEIDGSTEKVPEVQASGRLLISEIDGELLILDTYADQIHQLNQTAAEIWRLFGRGEAPLAIARELAFRFEVELSEAEVDVQEALRKFRSLGLLTSIERAASADGR